MFKRIVLFAMIVMLFLAVQAGRANADLVVNGGFTTGDFTGWTLGGDTSNPLAWYTVNNDGSLPNPYYAQFGTAGSPLTISQTLATAAGGAYTVSFFLKNDLPANTSQFQALWDGTAMTNLTTGMSSAWTQYSFTATALGSDVLTFSFLQDTSVLDITNVSASAVPIPAAIWLLGSGLVGLIGIRRRSM